MLFNQNQATQAVTFQGRRNPAQMRSVLGYVLRSFCQSHWMQMQIDRYH